MDITIKKIAKQSGQYRLTLSNNQTEILNPTTLDCDDNEQITCRVKDGQLLVPFASEAVTGLKKEWVKKGEYHGLVIQGIFYPIKNVIRKKISVKKTVKKAVKKNPKKR